MAAEREAGGGFQRGERRLSCQQSIRRCTGHAEASQVSLTQYVDRSTVARRRGLRNAHRLKIRTRHSPSLRARAASLVNLYDQRDSWLLLRSRSLGCWWRCDILCIRSVRAFHHLGSDCPRERAINRLVIRCLADQKKGPPPDGPTKESKLYCRVRNGRSPDGRSAVIVVAAQ